MFDLGGWGQIIIIAFIAIIIIKPSDLPKVVKEFSKFIYKVKKYKYEIQNYYYESIQEAEREYIIEKEKINDSK